MNKNETLPLAADINKLSIPSSSSDSVLYTVIKEFNARLGDEVNLNIGDIVELISDDSEYGDGWYMGKNLSTNNVGLYPKAFTQIISKNTNGKKQGLLRSRSRRLTPAGSPVTPTTNPTSYFPTMTTDENNSKTSSNNITPNPDGSNINNVKSFSTDPSLPNSNSNSRSTSYNNNLNQQIMRQNSTATVRNTLNDINKALEELNSNQTTASANTTGNDSSIAYNGSSTPTKESFQSPELPVLNPAEVESWTPSQVTQYFSYLNFDLDTAGQFARHKISGLILIQMELSHLKELDIASFGTRFELFKEIEELKTATKERKVEEKYGNSTTPSANTTPKALVNVNANTTPASDSSEFFNNRETKLYGIGITKAASQRRQNYTHTRQRSQSMDDVKELLPKRSSMAINNRDDDSEDDELELYESPRKAPHPPPSASDASSPANSSPAFQSNPNFRFGSGGAQNSINNSNNNNNSFSQQQYSRMSMFEPHSRNVSIGASSSVYNDPHHSRTSSSLSYINSSNNNNNINSNNNASIPTTPSANYCQRNDSILGNKLPNNNFAATTTTLDSTISEDRLVKTIPKYSSLLSVNDKETVYLGSPTEDKIPEKELPKSPKKNTQVTGEEDDEDEDDEHGDYQDASDELGVHTTPTQKEARFSSTLKKLGFSPKRRSISAKEYSTNNSRTMDPKRVSSSILPLPATLDAPENGSANDTPGNRLSKNISRPLPAVPLPTAKGAVGGNDSSDNSNSSTPTSTHPSTMGNTTPTQSTAGRASSALRTLTTRRTKVQTSAYLEGIRDITPDEAIKTADYSGWMNKRGNLTLGSWKNRFFTLHKTRLSYFTSTKDKREKGVIDITSHRVLAAVDSEDKISAAYAASTGSGNYCFKIVPPAPGSRKGLTFTQQKVHYFAVETRAEMRAWMAALMKATIELDETQPVISSCVTPTIPIKQAQEMMAKAREQARLNLENLKLNNFNEGENSNNGNNAILDNGSFSSDTTSPTNTFTNNNISEKSTPLTQLAGQFSSPAQLSLNSNGSGSNRRSVSTNNRLNGLSINTHNTTNTNNLDSSTPTSATLNGSPYQEVKEAFTDIPNGLSTPYLMTSGMALPSAKGPLEINDPVSDLSHSSSTHSVFVYNQTNPKAPDYNNNKTNTNNNGSTTASLNTAPNSASPSTAGNNNNTSFATSVSSTASSNTSSNANTSSGTSTPFNRNARPLQRLPTTSTNPVPMITKLDDDLPDAPQKPSAVSTAKRVLSLRKHKD
ncbi:hypothetical protein B5S29_g4169 [[Candida] boidinii]|nr:hypothetical protein B5S29_g4169 [[Candida] boidinii]